MVMVNCDGVILPSSLARLNVGRAHLAVRVPGVLDKGEVSYLAANQQRSTPMESLNRRQ